MSNLRTVGRSASMGGVPIDAKDTIVSPPRRQQRAPAASKLPDFVVATVEDIETAIDETLSADYPREQIPQPKLQAVLDQLVPKSKRQVTQADVEQWKSILAKQSELATSSMLLVQRRHSALSDYTRDPEWLKAQEMSLRFTNMILWLQSDSNTKKTYTVLMIRALQALLQRKQKGAKAAPPGNGVKGVTAINQLVAAMRLNLRL